MNLNKKDTYRNYAIWAVLLLFYGVFYFINNRGWINELDIEIENSDSSTIVLESRPDFSFQENDTTLPEAIDSIQANASNNKKPNYREDNISGNPRPQPIIEINLADADDWQSLYNIGPYRAEKIVNFRSALGGFYSVQQVGETYALPDSVFQAIKPQLKFSTTWNKIPINFIIYDSLFLHPYITKQMAYYIVKFREKNGVIHNIDELKEIIEDKDHERLRKLEPYLNFGIK